MSFTRNNYKVVESFVSDTGRTYAKVVWKGIEQTGYISRLGGPGRTISKSWYKEKKRERGKWRTIIGGIQDLQDGIRVTIKVDGRNEARDILSSKSSKWESFQAKVTMEFMCKGGKDPQKTTGFGEVYSEIRKFTYEVPETELVYDEKLDKQVEDFVGYKETEGDTVDMTFREAKDNAFAHIDCSMLYTEVIQQYLILYIGDGEKWEKQANEKGQIKIK